MPKPTPDDIEDDNACKYDIPHYRFTNFQWSQEWRRRLSGGPITVLAPHSHLSKEIRSYSWVWLPCPLEVREVFLYEFIANLPFFLCTLRWSKRPRHLRLGACWNMKECYLAYDVMYSSLHQRTPIKRVINMELFLIVSLIEIRIRKVFHFIYFLIFWHFRFEKP